jgi:hypothetical protein
MCAVWSHGAHPGGGVAYELLQRKRGAVTGVEERRRKRTYRRRRERRRRRRGAKRALHFSYTSVFFGVWLCVLSCVDVKFLGFCSAKQGISREVSLGFRGANAHRIPQSSGSAMMMMMMIMVLCFSSLVGCLDGVA